MATLQFNYDDPTAPCAYEQDALFGAGNMAINGIVPGRPARESELWETGATPAFMPPDLVIAGFPFNRIEVPESEKAKLIAIARKALSGAKGPILLIGHTDPVGSAKYNEDLGKRRAAEVRRLLDLAAESIRKGSSVSLAYAPYQSPGATQPIAPNNSPKNRSLNRRVEIFLPVAPGRVPPPSPRVPPGPVPPPRRDWTPTPVPPQTVSPPPPPPRPRIVDPGLPYDPWDLVRSGPQLPSGKRSHWLWKAITGAAGLLGVTVSTGLTAIPVEILEKAVLAALFELTAEGVAGKTEAAALGKAGERVTQVILEHTLEGTGKRVYDLNEAMKNFPLFDLINPDEIPDIKSFGPLTGRTYEEVRGNLLAAWRQLIGLDWDPGSPNRALTKAANAMLKIRSQIPAGALPPAIRSARTVQAMEAALQELGTLRIPDDFVSPLVRDAQKALLSKWNLVGKKLPGARGISIARQIKVYTDKIKGIGLTSRDLRILVEVARETRPGVKSKELGSGMEYETPSRTPAQQFAAILQQFRKELALPFMDPNDPRLYERRLRLRRLFAGVPREFARGFRDRLGVRPTGDELSRLFHGKLHAATRKELLDILSRIPAPAPPPPPAKVTVWNTTPLPPAAWGRFMAAVTKLEAKINASTDPRKWRYQCWINKLKNSATDDRVIRWATICPATTGALGAAYVVGPCDLAQGMPVDQAAIEKTIQSVSGVDTSGHSLGIITHLRSAIVVAEEMTSLPLENLRALHDEVQRAIDKLDKWANPDLGGGSAMPTAYVSIKDWIGTRQRDPNSIYSCM